MPRPARRTPKRSRRLQVSGKFVAQPSVSPGRTVRATRKKGDLVFTAFVSKETPTSTKIELIRTGVVARVVDDMVEYLDVPKTVIFAILHTPESTAHKLIRDNRTLDSAASERVVRVADIARMAQETFGGRKAAAQWLRSSNLALGGATPLSMLDTEPGAGEVRRILASIDRQRLHFVQPYVTDGAATALPLRACQLSPCRMLRDEPCESLTHNVRERTPLGESDLA